MLNISVEDVIRDSEVLKDIVYRFSAATKPTKPYFHGICWVWRGWCQASVYKHLPLLSVQFTSTAAIIGIGVNTGQSILNWSCKEKKTRTSVKIRPVQPSCHTAFHEQAGLPYHLCIIENSAPRLDGRSQTPYVLNVQSRSLVISRDLFLQELLPNWITLPESIISVTQFFVHIFTYSDATRTTVQYDELSGSILDQVRPSTTTLRTIMKKDCSIYSFNQDLVTKNSLSWKEFMWGHEVLQGIYNLFAHYSRSSTISSGTQRTMLATIAACTRPAVSILAWSIALPTWWGNMHLGWNRNLVVLHWFMNISGLQD